MEDASAPHKGPFTFRPRIDGPPKVYDYRFHPANPSYVVWHNLGSKEGTAGEKSLIYVARPFLSSVDNTERRNLLYPFKSLLSRDSGGRLQAGLYFKLGLLQKTRVTIFYPNEDGDRVTEKIPLARFLLEPLLETRKNPCCESPMEALEKLQSFFKKDIKLMLSFLATFLQEESEFLGQLLSLNERIIEETD